MHHDRTQRSWQKSVIISYEIVWNQPACLYKVSMYMAMSLRRWGPEAARIHNWTPCLYVIHHRIKLCLSDICITYFVDLYLHSYSYFFVFALTDAEFWWCISRFVSVRSFIRVTQSTAHFLLYNLYFLDLYLYFLYFYLYFLHLYFYILDLYLYFFWPLFIRVTQLPTHLFLCNHCCNTNTAS